jgi:hypothetical protein
VTWDNRKDRQLRNQLDGKKFGIGQPTGVTGILVRLFRTMLNDLGINGIKWNRLMEEYLRIELIEVEKKRRQKKGLPPLQPGEPFEINRRDRTSVRGNLNKEFNRKIMTWKVFCKGMRFLQLKRFKIIILAEDMHGKITEHSTIVTFADAAQEIAAPDDPAEAGDHESPIEGSEKKED